MEPPTVAKRTLLPPILGKVLPTRAQKLLVRVQESQQMRVCSFCQTKQPSVNNTTTKFCRIFPTSDQTGVQEEFVRVRVVVVRQCEELLKHVRGKIKQDKVITRKAFENKPAHERKVDRHFLNMCHRAKLDLALIPLTP